MSKIACVFPGQGSQQIGMLAELAQQFPSVKQTFDKASEKLGYDLFELTQQGPEQQLNQTEYAQPALLVAGYAAWQVWCENNSTKPLLLAGHSLGEYTALVCAGAMDFLDAVMVVAERGRLMQQAVPMGKGAMAAIIGLTPEQVVDVCEQAAEGQILTPANFNAIGQTVISGETEAVSRAIEIAKQSGAKIAKLIPVSVPSHSPMMKSAAEKLAIALQKIALYEPKIPVVNNVDVIAAKEPDEMRSALVRQLYSPVRWVETIQYFAQHDIQRIYELGPGNVLAGLIKRIDRNIEICAI